MKDLTKGNIYKTFLPFAIPLILSGALSQAYQTADTVIAGKYLGENGLASIGSTASFITLISSIFWGSNMGLGVYIAKLFGGNKHHEIIENFKFHFTLLLIANIAISVLSITLAKYIFALLNIEEIIYQSSYNYYVVYVGGLFFFSLQNMLVKFLHGLGVSGITLTTTITSAILNVVGNLITVAVIGTGVVGLAISSVFSAFIGCLICIIYLMKCFRKFKKSENYHTETPRLKRSLSFTLPTSIQQFFMYVFTLLISPLVNKISVSAIAAYALAQRIYSINADVYQNSSSVIGTYTAQCVGTGRASLIKKGLKAGIIQSLIIISPVLLTCILFPNFVAKLFLNETESSETLNYVVVYSKYYMPFLITNVINNCFHNLYRGTGNMVYLITVTFFGSVVRLIASYVFVQTQGLNGIYLAWAISWCAEAVLNFAVFLSGKWKPKLPAE